MGKRVVRIEAPIFAILAFGAAIFTPLSSALAQQTRAIGGDAVIAWNANAGVAATKACITPLDSPFHESRLYAMMHMLSSVYIRQDGGARRVAGGGGGGGGP
jgi:hypothetical protein